MPCFSCELFPPKYSPGNFSIFRIPVLQTKNHNPRIWGYGSRSVFRRVLLGLHDQAHGFGGDDIGMLMRDNQEDASEVGSDQRQGVFADAR